MNSFRCAKCIDDRERFVRQRTGIDAEEVLGDRRAPLGQAGRRELRPPRFIGLEEDPTHVRPPEAFRDVVWIGLVIGVGVVQPVIQPPTGTRRSRARRRRNTRKNNRTGHAAR